MSFLRYIRHSRASFLAFASLVILNTLYYFAHSRTSFLSFPCFFPVIPDFVSLLTTVIPNFLSWVTLLIPIIHISPSIRLSSINPDSPVIGNTLYYCYSYHSRTFFLSFPRRRESRNKKHKIFNSTY